MSILCIVIALLVGYLAENHKWTTTTMTCYNQITHKPFSMYKIFNEQIKKCYCFVADLQTAIIHASQHPCHSPLQVGHSQKDCNVQTNRNKMRISNIMFGFGTCAEISSQFIFWLWKLCLPFENSQHSIESLILCNTIVLTQSSYQLSEPSKQTHTQFNIQFSNQFYISITSRDKQKNWKKKNKN